MRLYILDGHTPVPESDTLKWAHFLAHTPRHVRYFEGFGPLDGVRVSTVFLGVNHQFGEGPPLLFETMVFGGERDGEQHRWSTWEDAEAGHERIVEELAACQL